MSAHPSKRRLRQNGSALGNLLALVLVLGLVGLGGYLVINKMGAKEPAPPPPPTQTQPAPQPRPASSPAADGPGLAAPLVAQAAPAGPAPVEPLQGSPILEAAAAYVPKDNVIEVDISEYAGYSGLVVANGGLEPNDDSFFKKHYGFKVKLSLSEGENWSKLNNGRFAASTTTVDVLAVLGRSFQVAVPALIGFSRGADMVVVDRGIASINQLKGKVIAASQFNESEFFLRYLLQEAGLKVKVLRDLDARPGPEEVGLVFYEDAFSACDAYAAELARTQPRLNGAVGWTPRTDEVVAGSGQKAKVLVSNRNLLLIADILCVNKGFAQARPAMVKGLVHGLLEGNRLLRENPDAHLATVAAAFGWRQDQARAELARVHLANLPENQAFFKGTIDAAGSFGAIYQSSVLAYGPLIKQPADSDRFVDLGHLAAIAAEGHFANAQIAIAPIRTRGRDALEGEALLSKDVRFFFEPNSAVLDAKAKENIGYLETVQKFLQVGSGSVVVLRGHVDNLRIEEFRKKGGEQLVHTMALKAMELSKQRALAVKAALLERYPKTDPGRLETIGRGWEEPAGPDSELNRRVEVQWFTLE